MFNPEATFHAVYIVNRFELWFSSTDNYTLFQGSAKAEMEVTKTTKSVTIDADGATTTTVESTTTSGDGAASGGAKAGTIYLDGIHPCHGQRR